MSNIIVTNIPEKFTIEQVFTLLEQSNIPCNNRSVKIIKSNRVQREASSGRYCILNFDTDVIATTAIQAINQIVLTVNQQEVFIRAMPFIQNFKQLSQDPERNIVIYNLPKELGNQDLTEIFQDFGKVLSAIVKKGIEDRPSMGYVLFEHKNDAKKALEEADGKYLGPNKILIKSFRTIEDRIANNSEVLLLSAGTSDAFTPDAAKTRLKQLYPNLEFAPNTEIYIKNDPRPEEINSQGAAWIFTAENPMIAKDFIKEINEKNYNFEGVKEQCKAMSKLSRGILARMKAQTQNENRKKYSDSGASIQVFNLKKNLDKEAVKRFFEKYGHIEEPSGPAGSIEVQPELFHLNILYSSAQEADRAIADAQADEAKLPERLAEDGKQLRVTKYQAKSDVKSTSKRPVQKENAAQSPM